MAEETKNPLEMSDEDILKMNPPEIEEPKEEPHQEEEEKQEESPNEGEDSKEESKELEENNDSENKTSEEESKEELTEESKEEPKKEEENVPSNSGSEEEKEKSSKEAEKKEENKEQPSEKSATIDYKKFYEKIMTPFKANGKLITLKTPEEAIQLMQMGANYTRKMQAIAPYKKTLLMLENNGLLDENKLSFLIDLDKKNPEAIKKLIKDAGIDPMDIDTSTEPQYKEGSHKVSNEEAAFMTVLDDLKQSQDGMQTIKEINSNWDDASKNILWSSPDIMRTIHQQRENGVYQLIVDEKKGRDILEDADSYDFMILRESIIKEKEKFRFHPLYEDRLCAVVYEDHPLAERKEIQLKELEGEIFVFPLKGSGSYEFFYDSCHKAGFVPDIQYEFPQANTIMSFVKEHVGLTVTFTKVFEEVSLSCQGIRMIPLTDDFRSPISLIYPRKQPLDPAEKMFLKYIRSL